MTVPTETRPPVPGCLVITDEPSASISAIGKPGTRPSATSSKNGVVAAGGLGAALEHVAGDDRAGERVPVVARPAVPPRRGPDHQRGVGDPAGDDDVGARRSASAMPQPPR